MKKIALAISFILFSTFIHAQNNGYFTDLKWGMSLENLIKVNGMENLTIKIPPKKIQSFITFDTIVMESWIKIDSSDYTKTCTYWFDNDSLDLITCSFKGFSQNEDALNKFSQLLDTIKNIYGLPSIYYSNGENDLYNKYCTWNTNGEHVTFSINTNSDSCYLYLLMRSIYVYASSWDAELRRLGKKKLAALGLAFDYSNKKEIREALIKEGGKIITDNNEEISCIPDNLTFANFKVELVVAGFYDEFGFYKMDLLLKSSEYTIEKDFHQIAKLYNKKFPEALSWPGYGLVENYTEPYFKGDGFFPQALRLKAVTLASKYLGSGAEILIAALYFNDEYYISISYQDALSVNEIRKRKEEKLMNQL